MENSDFEGSIILERLAEVGKVDEFYEAVDADNLSNVRSLLTAIGFDDEIISIVIDKIENDI